MSQFPYIPYGGKLPNRTSVLNPIVDAARQNQAAPRPQAAALLGKTDPVTIWVKNNCGTDVSRFGVLGLGDVQITQSDNDVEFYKRIYMDGEEPAVDTHYNRFAIALEPIRDGGVGRCVVDGLVQCQVNIGFPWHKYADVEDGVVGRLQSSWTGSSEILWSAASTGIQWCIVRLNTGPKLLQPFPVLLNQSGGTDGDSGSAATWTYDVQDLDGNTLFSAVDPTATPHNLPREVGKVTAATSGLAFAIAETAASAPAITLAWINESYTALSC